jgi:hypothetical protein
MRRWASGTILSCNILQLSRKVRVLGTCSRASRFPSVVLAFLCVAQGRSLAQDSNIGFLTEVRRLDVKPPCPPTRHAGSPPKQVEIISRADSVRFAPARPDSAMRLPVATGKMPGIELLD